MTPRLRMGGLWVGRCALAALFVYAALPKLSDPGEFATAIANYQLLPAASGLLALLVPAAELVVAVGLLTPPLQRGSTFMAALLFLVFAIAMAQARTRGIDLRCGCFNAAIEAKVSWWTVARSAALCAFAWLLFSMSSQQPSGRRGERGDPPVTSSS